MKRRRWRRNKWICKVGKKSQWQMEEEKEKKNEGHKERKNDRNKEIQWINEKEI